MSVRVENLTKIYGEQRAVDSISFEIGSGQIVGFLGPNGAGKSTTMKMLTGYLAPTSGKAWVCGLDVEAQSLEVRRKIGYLPEHNPLYTEMYIREYLYFIAGLTHYAGNTKARVEELIDITGLRDEAHKKIGMLSKGYRQRVGLAHALLHDPEVLILDEPTSGLDPNQLVDIRNLIREVGKAKTVILSTHIMQEVQAMCSRVIIISKGRIVADDSTQDLTERYSGRNYVRVQFKKPVDAAALKTINGLESAEQRDGFWILQSAAQKDIREELFRWTVQQDNVLLEMVKEGRNLESVFQELTRKTMTNDQ